MTAVLSRNRIADFSKWKTIFDSHAPAHRDAGLHLKALWRDLDRPDTVYFLFEVKNLETVRALLKDPAVAEGERDAGVLESEYHFLERAPHDLPG